MVLCPSLGSPEADSPGRLCAQLVLSLSEFHQRPNLQFSCRYWSALGLNPQHSTTRHLCFFPEIFLFVVFTLRQCLWRMTIHHDGLEWLKMPKISDSLQNSDPSNSVISRFCMMFVVSWECGCCGSSQTLLSLPPKVPWTPQNPLTLWKLRRGPHLTPPPLPLNACPVQHVTSPLSITLICSIVWHTSDF